MVQATESLITTKIKRKLMNLLDSTMYPKSKKSVKFFVIICNPNFFYFLPKNVNTLFSAIFWKIVINSSSKKSFNSVRFRFVQIWIKYFENIESISFKNSAIQGCSQSIISCWCCSVQKPSKLIATRVFQKM